MTDLANARVALYSHDSTGLGHVRRNLLLAGEFSRLGADVLLLSGSPEATAMARPPATDIVTLPALRKSGQGRYEARHLSMQLDEMLAMRRDLASAALHSFAPDLLIVDRHARGFLNELQPALASLSQTRKVLGLRDVLDDPARVRKEWTENATNRALATWYDEVWLYGDQNVHDPLRAAGLNIEVPVFATGYLVATRPTPPVSDLVVSADRPYVLCMVGGGADGEDVATAVLEAQRPCGVDLIVVTGPQMPHQVRATLASRAESAPGVQVIDYVHDPAPLLNSAAAAIVMGGYNTVCEVLASTTPTLVVPRATPRLEQTIRATVLGRHGGFDVIQSDLANARSITAWIEGAVGRHRDSRGVDIAGIARVGSRAAGRINRADPRTSALTYSTASDVYALPLSTQGVSRAAV